MSKIVFCQIIILFFIGNSTLIAQSKVNKNKKILVYSETNEDYLMPLIEQTLYELPATKVGKDTLFDLVIFQNRQQNLLGVQRSIKSYTLSYPSLKSSKKDSSSIIKLSDDFINAYKGFNFDNFLLIKIQKLSNLLEYQFFLYEFKLNSQSDAIPIKSLNIFINPLEDEYELKLKNSIRKLFANTNSTPKIILRTNALKNNDTLTTWIKDTLILDISNSYDDDIYFQKISCRWEILENNQINKAVKRNDITLDTYKFIQNLYFKDTTNFQLKVSLSDGVIDTSYIYTVKVVLRPLIFSEISTINYSEKQTIMEKIRLKTFYKEFLSIINIETNDTSLTKSLRIYPIKEFINVNKDPEDNAYQKSLNSFKVNLNNEPYKLNKDYSIRSNLVPGIYNLYIQGQTSEGIKTNKQNIKVNYKQSSPFSLKLSYQPLMPKILPSGNERISIPFSIGLGGNMKVFRSLDLDFNHFFFSPVTIFNSFVPDTLISNVGFKRVDLKINSIQALSVKFNLSSLLFKKFYYGNFSKSTEASNFSNFFNRLGLEINVTLDWAIQNFKRTYILANNESEEYKETLNKLYLSLNVNLPIKVNDLNTFNLSLGLGGFRGFYRDEFATLFNKLGFTFGYEKFFNVKKKRIQKL